MIIPIEKRIDNQIAKVTNSIVLSGSNLYPPHIGLAISGQYFSCSANKVKTGISFQRVFNNIKRRNYKIIIAELNFIPDYLTAEQVFTNYGVLNHNKTCLIPVKKTIEICIDKKISSHFVYELLPILEQENLIKNYSHFGLDDKIVKNEIHLFRVFKE
jgi:hypothetical protein